MCAKQSAGIAWYEDASGHPAHLSSVRLAEHLKRSPLLMALVGLLSIKH